MSCVMKIAVRFDCPNQSLFKIGVNFLVKYSSSSVTKKIAVQLC